MKKEDSPVLLQALHNLAVLNLWEKPSPLSQTHTVGLTSLKHARSCLLLLVFMCLIGFPWEMFGKHRTVWESYIDRREKSPLQAASEFKNKLKLRERELTQQEHSG